MHKPKTGSTKALLAINRNLTDPNEILICLGVSLIIQLWVNLLLKVVSQNSPLTETTASLKSAAARVKSPFQFIDERMAKVKGQDISTTSVFMKERWEMNSSLAFLQKESF